MRTAEVTRESLAAALKVALVINLIDGGLRGIAVRKIVCELQRPILC
jgi:uncharacterized protein with ATP-grasp and redox domains